VRAPAPQSRPRRAAASRAVRQVKAGKGMRRLLRVTLHADLRPHMRDRHQNIPAHPCALTFVEN